MKLYFLPGSCAMATHIVLNELGVPAEFVKVDRATRTTPDGENYYTVSPNGYVPALKLDDGNVLLENAAILPYVGDLKPEAGWMPQSGFARYRALEWLGYANMELHGNFRPFFAGVDEAAKEIFRKRLVTRYKRVDEALAKSPFLTGDRPIVADAYVHVVTRWASGQNVDLSSYGNVAAFQERMAGRPAVQKTIKEEGLPA
jgi:glutathione S-transferase